MIDAMRARAIVAMAIASGCSFATETPGPRPGELCPFELVPDTIDPCAATPPADLEDLPDVTLTDMAAIDTGNGEIVGPNVFTPPPTTIVDGVRVVWTKTFTIGTGGNLHAYGDLPLAIVATSAIRIEGTLDATTSVLARGAGANPMSCAADQATGGMGQQCAQHGGSGGGGGAFMAAGGPGGEGGDTHDCGGDGRPGGPGGKAIARPTKLRGGCAGGDGAPSNGAGMMIGPGGAGGGAIALIARDKVIVAGKILAGGGGGQPGRDRAGGGGGGAGGMIVIEAVDVDLQPTSIVAANGGGGAGGGDSGVGEAGEPGLPAIDDADGGEANGAGGQGGDGGIVGFEAGFPGELATRGGGGGGGSVGFIRVHAKTGSQSGVATPAITN